MVHCRRAVAPFVQSASASSLFTKTGGSEDEPGRCQRSRLEKQTGNSENAFNGLLKKVLP